MAIDKEVINMKEVIPVNDYGLFVNKNNDVLVDSRYIAKIFDMHHKHILQAIDNLLKKQGLSDEFSRTNFRPSNYNTRGKTYRCYNLTRDGFVMLVMGFTSKKATRFKEWYINKFNEMEQQLTILLQARVECPDLTDALKDLNSDNKFIYSNEFNMINKMVLGLSTKDFRELHGVKKGESIRPYLTKQQIELIQKLQKYDSVLVELVPSYKERKIKLTEKYHKLLDNIGK